MEQMMMVSTTDTMYQEGRYCNIYMEQQFYIEREEENCIQLIPKTLITI